MARKRSWTFDDLKTAVDNGKSVRDVVRKLGLAVAGGNCKAVKTEIARLNLNTDHFIRREKSPLAKAENLSVETHFTLNSKASKNTLKRILKRKNLIPFQCKCGLIDEWQGKKLVLQLEHKNGNTRDNNLENLEWLCANCHSQTSTYAGRNRNRTAWENGVKTFGVDYNEALSDPGFLNRKVSHEEVLAFYRITGKLRETARKFEITHQSVLYILRRADNQIHKL